MVVGRVSLFLGVQMAKNKLEHYVIHLVQEVILAKVHLIVNKSVKVAGVMMVFTAVCQVSYSIHARKQHIQ